VHRLPNGQLTSHPSSKSLQQLGKTPGGMQLPLGDAAGPTTPAPPGSNIAVTTETGFIGATTNSNLFDGASELEPPDQGLAVNNGVVFEIINNTVMIFNNIGTPLLGPIATDQYFGIGNPAHDFLSESDPQVFFDPFVNRWFVSELIWDANSGFAGFALAVSKTANALGGYYVYHVRAFGFSALGCFTATDASTCLPDFPKAGYNGDGFFITADMFASFGNGGFANAVTYALPIQKLINGQSFNYNAWVLTTSTGAPSSDFVIQPSIPAFGEGLITTNGGTEFMMEARNISDSTHNVRVIAVWNTNQIGTATGPNVAWADINPGLLYGSTVPAAEPNVPGPLCTFYGKPAPSLDAGYQSFTANIIVADGELWGMLPYAALDGNGFSRDVAGLFVVAPHFNPAVTPPLQPVSLGTATLTGGNGQSVLNPTLAMDSTHGTGGIGATFVGQSSPYPSTAVVPFRFTGAPFLAVVPPVFQMAGQAADDGFTGCQGAGVGRWGDYGMATVDTATGMFWFGNEYIPYPTQTTDGQFTNWGTFITQLGLQ
jgi:hypothetical protein